MPHDLDRIAARKGVRRIDGRRDLATCPVCDGAKVSTPTREVECGRCRGRGYNERYDPEARDGDGAVVRVDCPACGHDTAKGRRTIPAKPCGRCRGEGGVEVVDIEAGRAAVLADLRARGPEWLARMISEAEQGHRKPLPNWVVETLSEETGHGEDVPAAGPEGPA